MDDDTNKIVAWQWRLIPVNDDLAQPDPVLQKFIDSYKDVVDRKYGSIVCRFAQTLTRPRREEETPLGNLFADVFAARWGRYRLHRSRLNTRDGTGTSGDAGRSSPDLCLR